jgi:predicted methyltransferase
MKPTYSAAILLAGLIAAAPTITPAIAKNHWTPFQKKVAAALKMPHRSAKNRARDRNRDPVRALHFCRMKDDMKVLDWAPGRGWYTEILGPLLKRRGELYVSTLAASLKRIDPLLELEPMSKVKKLPVDVSRHPVSHDITVNNIDFKMRDADMVLNFREYHNLDRSTVLQFNRAAFKALKPGGYYCIIDHTRRHMGPDTHENRRRVDPVLVIKQVQAAGFKFVDYSKMFLRPDDELRYDVGRRTIRRNSDRFTLLFQKPSP